jgi:hypothetical protein
MKKDNSISTSCEFQAVKYSSGILVILNPVLKQFLLVKKFIRYYAIFSYYKNIQDVLGLKRHAFFKYITMNLSS